MSDKSNLICKYLFNCKINNEDVFPKQSIHDKEYAELFVKFCIEKYTPYIKDDKVNKYLLIYKKQNDKSKFFNKFGYNLSNWTLLQKQLLENTDFSSKKLSSFINRTFTIVANSYFKDLNNNRKIYIKTIWQVCEDKKLSMVTVDIGERHGNII